MTTTTLVTTTGWLPPRLRAALDRISGDLKHELSSLSTLDVLWVLYDQILRVHPDTADDPDRDRFLLSKGHGPAAYYAVLAAKGFVPVEWLDDFGGPDSRLGHHPDRTLIPGVEISSGSLGHGLPLAVGTVLGLRLRGEPTPAGARPRVYVLIGDAELDEGSNHEAIAYAGAVSRGSSIASAGSQPRLEAGTAGAVSRGSSIASAGSQPRLTAGTAGVAGLAELTAIVIDNGSSTHGWPGGIAARFAVNGWTTATVSGRDHQQLAAALRGHDGVHPHVVVAVTESKES